MHKKACKRKNSAKWAELLDQIDREYKQLIRIQEEKMKKLNEIRKRLESTRTACEAMLKASREFEDQQGFNESVRKYCMTIRNFGTQAGDDIKWLLAMLAEALCAVPCFEGTLEYDHKNKKMMVICKQKPSLIDMKGCQECWLETLAKRVEDQP